MQQYLDLMKNVYVKGDDREGRNGVTRSLFARQLRYEYSSPNRFPALTTKKLAFNVIKAELLWFLEGSGDDNRLKEILGKNRTIWSDNAEADYWKPKARFPGDLGRIYGVQWRRWKTPNGELDQIGDVIASIKKDPYGRRHVVSAWNTGELDQMALPPCHMLYQFYVVDDKLSLTMTQRSADLFLGVPFNIASYALLLAMVAQVTELKPHELVITFNDAHIYHEHLEVVEEQLTRKPYTLPKLVLNPDIRNIDDFTMNDIKLVDYKYHPKLAAKMVV